MTTHSTKKKKLRVEFCSIHCCHQQVIKKLLMGQNLSSNLNLKLNQTIKLHFVLEHDTKSNIKSECRFKLDSIKLIHAVYASSLEWIHEKYPFVHDIQQSNDFSSSSQFLKLPI